MLLSLILLAVSAVLIGVLLATRRTFGQFSRSLKAATNAVVSLEDTLTEIDQRTNHTMVHRPPKLPEHRPYSPGQDDLEIFPSREHSA